MGRERSISGTSLIICWKIDLGKIFLHMRAWWAWGSLPHPGARSHAHCDLILGLWQQNCRSWLWLTFSDLETNIQLESSSIGLLCKTWFELSFLLGMLTVSNSNVTRRNCYHFVFVSTYCFAKSLLTNSYPSSECGVIVIELRKRLVGHAGLCL